MCSAKIDYNVPKLYKLNYYEEKDADDDDDANDEDKGYFITKQHVL